MTIPFTKYQGGLKQMETNFKFPSMKELFELTFSRFNGLHAMYEDLQKQGITRIVTAAGIMFNFGVRNRRFAGGANLPSNRYFTICPETDFNDFGALRDEMLAYYSGSSGIIPTIFDPKTDTWLSDYLISQNILTREDLEYPYYLFIYEFVKATEENKHLSPEYLERVAGAKFISTYGIRQFIVDIDRIIDLRLPDTQDWFFKTFVALELENERSASEKSGLRFPPKKEISSFEELLPSIMSLETGGGDIFGQAVAAWLRDKGANGLIFPSARTTCDNRVDEGVIKSSKGWVLVLYKDAPPPEEKNLFGNKTTWKDPDHDHIRIKHISSGNEKGSLSICGAKEWNLLNFDLEKQFASGITEYSPVADLTGSKNFEISRMTNRILDKAEADNKLWFHDIDTTDFLNWHEKLWKK